MKNQIDVVTAKNNVTIAKSKVMQANSSYFPQLSIQNNAFHSGTGVLSKSTNGTAFDVSQSIFDGGIRESNAKSARYGATASNYSLTRTEQTVVFDVTTAYYDVLRAKHLAEASAASVRYTQELRDQVKTQAELGNAADVDVLPMEAQLANARFSLITAQNKVRTAALALQSAIGSSPQAGFDVVDIDGVPEPAIQPLNDYEKAALAARADISQFKANSGAANASLRAARINLYPRPVINAEYQRQIQGGFTTSGSQIVGGIVFDLFNGGANRAAYQEAKARQANATQQELQVRRDIQTQVEEAYLNLTSGKERLDASELSLKAAQANYDVQKERYAQNLAISLDLLNAEVQLTTAQSNAVQARYDYYTAIAQMEYAVGRQGGPNAE
jgi:outer membrane protein TolC